MKPSALALALFLAGCRDTALDDGSYRLVGSEAGQLPVRLDGGDSCFHMLRSGAVTIRGERYNSRLGIEIACPGRGVQQRSIVGTGQITARGDSVTFQDSAGVMVGHGAIRGESLAISGPLHRLFYVRQ